MVDLTLPAPNTSPAVLDEPVAVKVAPVSAAERFFAIDALRGLAVLGILVMNIPFFAMPDVAMGNPTIMGHADTANIVSWFVSHVLFEGKMRALFSMLFGAGVVILTGRAEDRGGASLAADIYYRRTIWLIIFGLLHAYFLWDGDILFWYGTLGLLLYPFRKLSGITLVLIGSLLLSILVAKGFYFQHELTSMQQEAAEADKVAAAGQPLTEEQTAARKMWNARRQRDKRQQDRITKNIKLHQSDYWTIFKKRAQETFRSHPIGLYQSGVDDVLGMMFIGMGLLKLGVITASRSMRFYLLLALAGYGIGISLNTYLAVQLMDHRYDPGDLILFYSSTYNVDRLFVAVGHAAVLMMLCKAGRMVWLTVPLAAVGQMALTNYLMQSAICTTLFYGYGLGWYAKLERYQLYAVVGVIWLFQLLLSPIWLRFFQFGPMEWLWRSLTYWRWQPFFKQQPAEPHAAMASAATV
jgi:uncharacterized protein